MLLALTFVVGAGFAFYQPAQQASVNDLVARAELPQAVSLERGGVQRVARDRPGDRRRDHRAGRHRQRAVRERGCASRAMIVAMRRVKTRAPHPARRPRAAVLRRPERPALRAALAALRAFILRTLSFTVCASALWALLPVIARDQLGLGAGGYGFLFAMLRHRRGRRRALDPAAAQASARSTASCTSATILWALANVLIAATGHVALAAVGHVLRGGRVGHRAREPVGRARRARCRRGCARGRSR